MKNLLSRYSPVPTGVAVFPREIYKPLRSWAAASYNIIHWSEQPKVRSGPSHTSTAGCRTATVWRVHHGLCALLIALSTDSFIRAHHIRHQAACTAGWQPTPLRPVNAPASCCSRPAMKAPRQSCCCCCFSAYLSRDRAATLQPGSSLSCCSGTSWPLLTRSSCEAAA